MSLDKSSELTCEIDMQRVDDDVPLLSRALFSGEQHVQLSPSTHRAFLSQGESRGTLGVLLQPPCARMFAARLSFQYQASDHPPTLSVRSEEAGGRLDMHFEPDRISPEL